MICRVGQKAWDKLELRLVTDHAFPQAPLRAVQILGGWIDQMGPAFAFEDRPAVLDRIRAIAAGQAFEEVPSPEELLRRWSDAGPTIASRTLAGSARGWTRRRRRAGQWSA